MRRNSMPLACVTGIHAEGMYFRIAPSLFNILNHCVQRCVVAKVAAANMMQKRNSFM